MTQHAKASSVESATRQAPLWVRGQRPGALAACATLTFALSACGGATSSTATSGSAAVPTDGRAASEAHGGDSQAESAKAATRSLSTAIREFGSKAGSRQSREIEASLHGYLDARLGGEWSKACSYVARSKRTILARAAASSGIEGGDCAGFLASELGRLSSSERAALGEVEVSVVRAEGERAYAIYANPQGAEFATPMQREGGDWWVAGIEVRPLSR